MNSNCSNFLEQLILRMYGWMYVVGALAAVLVAVGYVKDLGEDPLLVQKGVALPGDVKNTFQYIAEMNNLPKWFPNVLEFQAVDTRPMGVGKHFSEVYNFPLVGETTYDNVVIAYDPPRYISFISDMWLRPRVELVITQRDSSKYPIMVTWSMYSRRRSYLFRYSVVPFVKIMYSSQIYRALLNLRSNIMETTETPSFRM